MYLPEDGSATIVALAAVLRMLGRALTRGGGLSPKGFLEGRHGRRAENEKV